jgi:hypothetical protein
MKHKWQGEGSAFSRWQWCCRRGSGATAELAANSAGLETGLMSTFIDVQELPARLGEVLAQATAGDEVIVMDKKIPRVAR